MLDNTTSASPSINLVTSQAALPANKPDTSFLTRSLYQVAIPAAVQSMTSSSSNQNEPIGIPDKPFHQPDGDYDVICGRGKGYYNSPANKRFRQIVYQHIPEYLATRTKIEKSLLLGRIADQVRQQNNNGNHRHNTTTRFVKYDKTEGRWFEIGDDQVREKVGHVMREAIAAAKKKGKEVKQGTLKTKEAIEHIDLVNEHRQAEELILLSQRQKLLTLLLGWNGRA